MNNYEISYWELNEAGNFPDFTKKHRIDITARSEEKAIEILKMKVGHCGICAIYEFTKINY